MLDVVNKRFVFNSNVLPKHLKQTFPPIIWIFTEGDEMESIFLKSFLLYVPISMIRKIIKWNELVIQSLKVAFGLTELLDGTWNILVLRRLWAKMPVQFFSVQSYGKSHFWTIRVLRNQEHAITFCGQKNQHQPNAIPHISSEP